MAGGQLLHNGCLYVPLPLREEVLELCHDNKTAGHREIFRTQQRALREFRWPCIQGGIRDYVFSCHVQQANWIVAIKHSYPPPPNKSWDIVSIDFINDLPPV